MTKIIGLGGISKNIVIVSIISIRNGYLTPRWVWCKPVSHLKLRWTAREAHLSFTEDAQCKVISIIKPLRLEGRDEPQASLWPEQDWQWVEWRYDSVAWLVNLTSIPSLLCEVQYIKKKSPSLCPCRSQKDALSSRQPDSEQRLSPCGGHFTTGFSSPCLSLPNSLSREFCQSQGRDVGCSMQRHFVLTLDTRNNCMKLLRDPSTDYWFSFTTKIGGETVVKLRWVDDGWGNGWVGGWILGQTYLKVGSRKDKNWK